MGYYDGVAKSSFIARIDPEKCDYCGDCFSACNVKAIGRDKHSSKKVSEIKTAVCLGCGACISACSKNAISLIPRENPAIPIRSKQELFRKILSEKGRLSPFVYEIAKKKARKLFVRREK